MKRAKARGRLAGAHVMAPCRLSAPTAMLVTSTFPTDVSSSPMVERRLIPLSPQISIYQNLWSA